LFTYSLLLLSTWATFGFYARQFFVEGWGSLDPLVRVRAGRCRARWSISISARGVLGEDPDDRAQPRGSARADQNLRIFLDGGPDRVPVAAFTTEGVASGGFGLAVLFAFLCFGGFESSAIYREQAKDPVRTVPWATYVAVLVIRGSYRLAAIGMLTGIGSGGIEEARQGADVATMFSDLAVKYVGAVMPSIVNGLVIISTYATLFSQHNAVFRYLYSFGRDGVLPASLGKAHPKHHSPFHASLGDGSGDSRSHRDRRGHRLRGHRHRRLRRLHSRQLGRRRRHRGHALARENGRAHVLRKNPVTGAGGGPWRSLVAPLLGLAGISAVFVQSVSNLDKLIGAGPIVSAVLAVLVPLVFVVGWRCASVLQSRRADVYDRIGRQ
jgi:hypothetical protein